MNVVLLTHPRWLGLRSQERFCALLADALAQRGATVAVRQPRPRLHALAEAWHAPRRAVQIAGYADALLAFPFAIGAWRWRDPVDTLYVVCDQALGPWVPWLSGRPHVVHVHDLLALRGALEVGPGPSLRLSGRLYQRWIRSGFARAERFICTSRASECDLHRFGGIDPARTRVWPNPLAPGFVRTEPAAAWARLAAAGLPRPAVAPVLHVSNGSWTKNTPGAVAIHAAYGRRARARGEPVAPLWVLGSTAGVALDSHEVRLLPRLDDGTLAALYSVASALLFPSVAEGFGWPIAEALACGCAVLTTDAEPMTDVAGAHATLLPPMPARAAPQAAWADAAGAALHGTVQRAAVGEPLAVLARIEHSRRFAAGPLFDELFEIYRHTLAAAGGARALRPSST
jgi:glycosyltransferase involved in cell wall biosynthesis